MIEVLLLAISLDAEPQFVLKPYKETIVCERKRTHKRRRKIKKPSKGLR